MVSRDHAGHSLLVRHRLTHAHRYLAARAEPAAAGRVVDLDRSGAYAQQVRRLEGPGELFERGAASVPAEDLGERLALGLIAALVHVQEVAPGRTRLVIGV